MYLRTVTVLINKITIIVLSLAIQPYRKAHPLSPSTYTFRHRHTRGNLEGLRRLIVG